MVKKKSEKTILKESIKNIFKVIWKWKKTTITTLALTILAFVWKFVVSFATLPSTHQEDVNILRTDIKNIKNALLAQNRINNNFKEYLEEQDREIYKIVIKLESIDSSFKGLKKDLNILPEVKINANKRSKNKIARNKKEKGIFDFLTGIFK